MNFRTGYSLLLSSIFALALVPECVVPAAAQGTHQWTETRLDELEKGVAQGVALGSDGHLRMAPGATELAVTPSTVVWSVAAAADGSAYLGTAAPASVLRVGKEKSAKAELVFESKQVAVESVKIGPDGALYVATIPDGRVYRVDPKAAKVQDESSSTVVFDAAAIAGPSKEKSSHYIWDLSFDRAGRLYVATGAPAGIYRVDVKKPGAAPERFFASDEQHIRTMVWDAKGNLIAGSDGSGLVYRISPEGKGYVLFVAPRREITALAVDAAGTIYTASVGDKSKNPLPQLAVQAAGSMSFASVSAPGSQQVANASASIPEGSEIDALAENQAPRKLWAAKDDIVYALAWQQDGLLALTGNRGRIYKIAANGDFADVAHLDAQQGLAMSVAPSGEVLIGTGNTGKLYKLGNSDKPHLFASDVFDAGALARFGRLEVEPGSKGYKIYTRTGNVEQTVRSKGDWGWSDWQPLVNGKVASPAGRYFEWKAELEGDAELGTVTANYLAVNAAPVVDEVAVAPGTRWVPQPPSTTIPTTNINLPSAAAASATADSSSSSPLQVNKDRTGVTARWAAHDDNGDEMSYAIYVRGDGEKTWRLLKDNVSEKVYSFDAQQLPDGGYRLKVVATDAPSHNPGEALAGEKLSDRFELDTTAPVVSALKAVPAGDARKAAASFEAVDATSAIAHAEFSVDAGAWQTIEPVGALSDSLTESYRFTVPLEKGSEHLIVVRVTDRHENTGVAKTLFAAQ